MPIDASAVKWDTPDPAQVKWDDTPAAPKAVATPAAAPKPWTDVATDAAVNAIPSTLKMAGGIVHAVAHPIDTFNGLADTLEGATRNLAANNAPVKAYVDFMDNLFNTSPDAKAKTIALANQMGGVYKQKYGTLEGFKKSMSEDPAGVMADLSMLLGGAGGALRAGARVAGSDTAAMLGKAADVATTAGEATNPMTYAMKGVGAVAAPVARGVSAIATPLLTGAKNNFLLNAIGTRGEQIVNALRDTKNILVPGTAPTAGEMATGVGETKFSAAQKAAESVLPTEYFDRSAANRVAHQAALETVSGTPAIQKAATDSRNLTADALYGAAKRQSVKVDTALNDLLRRPSMEDAVAMARDMADKDKVGFGIKPRPQAEITGRDTLTNAPVEPPAYSVSDLHYLKIALDKLAGSGAAPGADAAKAATYATARRQLVEWMDEKSPSYRVARGVYASQSEPINQMEVGQVLKSALENPVLPTERRAAFANAMDNAAGTIKKATGQSRFQRLDEVLSPKQIEAVNGVRADIERQALMEAQAKIASGAAPNIQTASGDMLAQATGGAAVPGMLSRVTMTANAIMKRLEGKIDRKLAIELATDMLDPAKTAKAIETAMARQKQLAGRGEAIRGEGRIVGNALASQRGLVAGQVDNALAPQ